MKTYENFLSKLFNKNKVPSDEEIQELIDLKQKKIDDSNKKINDFLTSNKLNGIFIEKLYNNELDGYIHTSYENGNITILNDIMDFINSLSEEEIKILKRKTKAKEFNL